MPKSSLRLEPRVPEWFDSDTPCLCFSIRQHSLSHWGHLRCSISYTNAPLLPPEFSFQPLIPSTLHIVRIVIWEKWRKVKKRAGRRLGESGYKFYLSFLCIYFIANIWLFQYLCFLGSVPIVYYFCFLSPWWLVFLWVCDWLLWAYRREIENSSPKEICICFYWKTGTPLPWNRFRSLQGPEFKVENLKFSCPFC